ncbi:MAG: hypothetical protein AB2L11_08315 [Syntrophobacteraceae bacterium]
MIKQLHFQSLLPYLTSAEGGAGLKIALLSESETTLKGYSFPFLLISDSDSLTRLVKAEFVTDSGSIVKHVFLLVQRDAYSFPTNRMAPLTNADVDNFWRQTYQVRSQCTAGGRPITLQQQLDDAGKLTPFQSLFFCSATGTYFHPPCPACGAPLEPCSNDSLLESLGLPQYNLSLDRYLFCPDCFSSGKLKDFYTHQKNAHDAPFVKECSDLVRAFGQLVKERIEGSGLPCIVCPENERCFGSGVSTAPPIVPFSFYPFFMLIYEAMSLNGLDFVALLSGASVEELEARLRKTGELGRAAYIKNYKPGGETAINYLFADDSRLFLEILYLKLSFLGQIISERFHDSEKGQPDSLLYVDRIWVKLKDRSGLLPYLWNFELNYIDLVHEPLDLPAHPPMPQAYALHLLGLIWFTALLTNSKQEISQVHLAVEHARSRTIENDCIKTDSLMVEPEFLPENVFWNPAPIGLADDWHGLWEETLKIGWSLLQSSVQGESAGLMEKLVSRIEQLRTGIRREMFSENNARKDADNLAESGAIHGILSRIATKWSQSAVEEHGDEWEKTVVLPSDARFEATLPPGLASESADDSATVILAAPEAPQADASNMDEEIFEETVILSGKGIQGIFPTDEVPPKKDDEELSETIILDAPVSGAGPRAVHSAASPTFKDSGFGKTEGVAEELDKTVILSPSPQSGSRGSSFGEQEPTIPVEAASEDDLSETVILSPAREPQASRPSYQDQAVSQHDGKQSATPFPESETRSDTAGKKRKKSEEDDELSATIVLSPSKDRDKK